MYICDCQNNCVRSISSEGVVSLIAGDPTGSGSQDGHRLTQARFFWPFNAVFNESKNIFYITDTLNNKLRLLDLNTDEVSAFVGTGNAVEIDGIGLAAGFQQPFGIEVNSAWTTLYVSDGNGQTIR